MNSVVELEIHDEVALVRIDNPPVNALSHAVREGIEQALQAALANPVVQAILLHCEGRTFIAGADIREFGQAPKHPYLPELLAAIDGAEKLTVAAVHGTALGGGLETAMSCNYRIADSRARLGLPESTLGLLPGAGGTQRLPRLLGVEKAAEMMISGKPITALEAADIGLVDELAEGSSLLDEALAYTRRLLQEQAPLQRASDRQVQDPGEDVFAAIKKRAQQRQRGQEAPQRIIQCLQAAVAEPFERGLEIERALFLECMASPQSTAMRRSFFAERSVAKVPGISRDTAEREIASVAVIGAGTMGAGIALACINAGLSVTLLDTSAEGLQRGVVHIEKILDAQVRKGRISDSDKTARRQLLAVATDYAALPQADLVIEAVFESMAVKQEVFAALDKSCKPGAILATNTSTLDVDRIAASTGRPQDVIGLHFFSPANIMRLLEIVRGSETSNEVIKSSLSFSKRIGKLGVVVGNCFGFVGNRMLYGYGRENQFLLLEGAAPEQIDKALYDWGMAMGPNAVGDLAGLDVGYKVRQERDDLPDDPRYYRVATMLAEQGRYGQKTGKGTYLYKPGDRTPYPDPDVQSMIDAEAKRLGVVQRAIEDEEIIRRCILALVVEGSKILQEGIVVRSSDIDAVWVNGYGFPRYRGGPMCYADSLGLQSVYEQVCEFREQMGAEFWEPPALLKELAAAGQTFADYDSEQG